MIRPGADAYRPPVGRRLLAASAALALAAGCAEPLDTTRDVPERGTLGEEIFRLFHQDMARTAPRRADGFAASKQPFVDAVDHLFRPDELRYTQDFLVRLLPMYDDGTLPETTRSLAGAMTRLLEDEEALRSLAALEQRRGYVERSHREALLRRIAAYSEYQALTTAVLDLALAHDGLRPDGAPDPDEPAELRVLQSLLSERLTELELSAEAERDIVLLADLLLTEDERLARRDDPVLIVRRDPRGLARVSSAAVAPLGPFVDFAPQDGLPDTDLLGRFVDGEGRPIDVRPFDDGPGRDEAGRLIVAGEPAFAYADLDRTVLASLLRDGRHVVEQGVTMKAVTVFDEVLGARTEAGTYPDYDSPLLDLLYATAQALDRPELPDVFELLHTLLSEHEGGLGWVLLEVEAQLDVADRHPGGLRAGSTFLEDVLGWIRRVLAVPGLAEDLLEVLMDDPAALGIDEATVLLASHEKDLITAADYDAARVFVTPVDRDLADVPGNQSLAQRVFHLIADTKGASYEPRLIGIPLGFIFEIEDLAEFYMLSMVGEAEIPGLVSTLTGLPERPTPIDLARFINTDQTFGNPVGNEGLEVKENDGDTLFAVTASGMEDSLRPLVRVFHDHGQLDLLFDLLGILHHHWASEASDYQDTDPGAPRYSALSGIARFEPMLIEAFTEAKVLDATVGLLERTRDLRTTSGRRAHDLLLALTRHLMAPDTALLTREGEASVRIDGRRIIPMSRFDLLRAALADLEARIDRRNRTRADWDEVTRVLIDRFAGIERTGEQSGRLDNRAALPVLLAVLDFARGRAEVHARAGDLSEWVREDMLAAVQDGLTSPELPALFDAIYAIEEDEAVSAALTDLRDELLDEERGFADLLATVGDMLEAAKDAELAVPLLRFLGRELDPERRHLFTTLDLLRRSLELDPDEHLLEVARRGLETDPSTAELYLWGLTGAIRQANRIDPLDEGLMDHEDLRGVVTKTRDYLLDEQHGLEKFYQLVHDRKLENRE